MSDWQDWIGKVVILNGFGIVRILAAEGDRLLVGEPASPTAIPLAVVHSVEPADRVPPERPATSPAAVLG